jgi:CHAD domain-containing protein
VAPPDLAPAAPLDRRDTVEDLARAVLAGGAHRLVTADPVVRAGEDDEGVHQARVATRRLRSDLRTLRPILDPAWSEPLRDELRWIGGLLGGVRDADVLIGLLTEHADALRPGQHARATAFIGQIEEQRARDRATLLDAMDSTRYSALLDRLVAGADAPRLRPNGDTEPATIEHAAPQLVRKPWRRLRKQIRLLPTDPPDQDLHEVRKRTKQARYALEALVPVVGKQATRTAKRLAALQDTLGDHQDAVVAAAWIEEAALQSHDVDTAFVGGKLAETFAAGRRDARNVWPDQWERSRRAYHARTW